MKKDEIYIPMSALSAKVGIPVSTIKFYIREGLLPKPVKTGGTYGYYSKKHIERLNLINKIKNEGVRLKKIKEIVTLIDFSAEQEKNENHKASANIRHRIITSAIQLFREKGYDAVTIADITEAASIGCSTFYKNFKNKKDLFMDCIQKIISDEVSQTDVRKSDDKADISAVFDRDAEMTFRQDPLWRDMITMLRAAAITNPDEFADKLDEAIQLKIDMFEDRVEKGFELGYIRDVSKTLLAVMILGMQEACSEYFIKAQYTDSQRRAMFEEAKDIIFNGILKR